MPSILTFNVFVQSTLPCTKRATNLTGMFWKTGCSSSPGIGPKYYIRICHSTYMCSGTQTQQNLRSPYWSFVLD